MTDQSHGREIMKTVAIHAAVSKVWDTLTTPHLIKQWMIDAELEVITDWQTGSPIIFRGSLHWIDFENKGIILQLDPYKAFQYNYWSTLSGLSDVPENYTVVDFALSPAEKETVLALTLSNIPNEVIYKHLDFYWTVTLDILKKLCEQS
jgi:uncharacterized protein YndB with AHSA1/START domain